MDRVAGRRVAALACIAAVAGFVSLSAADQRRSSGDAAGPRGSCFLLYEVGVGEVRRAPDSICGRRLTPASTFKVPHAIAALDAAVLSDAGATIKYDGHEVPFTSWAHDQTLESAIHNSVVWYFQRVAERLGLDRERQYLQKLDYGNQDPSSGLTTFWLGGSLLISPEEQQRFILRLYKDDLPVSPRAMRIVRQILVQPPGRLVNATGEIRFAGEWPADTVVSAKTGSARDRTGSDVRWLVGHVQRGLRSWVFVSAVAGGGDTDALAAVRLAEQSLRDSHVL